MAKLAGSNRKGVVKSLNLTSWIGNERYMKLRATFSHFDTFPQKHHSPALPDHHPGEEIPQSPDAPGGPAECPWGCQSQVGVTWRTCCHTQTLLLLCAFHFKLISFFSPFFCSMIELEKDMGNLRSGLKSVESVSHKDLWENSRYVMITLFYSV